MTNIELKRLGQVELIKLIDAGQLIPIEDIRPDNSMVTDRISDQGYCIISNKQIQNFNDELVRLKIALSNKTDGHPLWEGES